MTTLDDVLADYERDLPLTVYRWPDEAEYTRRELIAAQQELAALASAPPTCLVVYEAPTETFEQRLVREYQERYLKRLSESLISSLRWQDSFFSMRSRTWRDDWSCLCSPTRSQVWGDSQWVVREAVPCRMNVTQPHTATRESRPSASPERRSTWQRWCDWWAAPVSSGWGI